MLIEKVSMRKSVVTIFFIFLVNLLSFSQQAEMHFKHITTDNGLPSNNVTSILQDELGFIWFGTKEGLCRYDGNSFQNFVFSESDTNTLSSNVVNCLEEDEHGNFWIGTGNGLNYFDISSYKISRMPHRFNSSIGTLPINYLCLSSNNILYISTTIKSLYAYNLNDQSLKHFQHNPNDTTSIIDHNISGIEEDGSQNIWIATSKGLELLDTTSYTFIHYFSQAGEGIRFIGLNANKDLVFSPTNDNGFYHVTNVGLRYQEERIYDVTGDAKVHLYVDSKDNQWISHRDKGLVFKNSKTGKSTFLRYDKENPNGLNSNSITPVLEDKDGNMWLATYDGGVNLLDANRKEFVHISEKTNLEFENNKVRALYQDSDGDVWIGSKVGGMLSKYNPTTGTFVHYKPNLNKPKSLEDDFIFSITEDRPGFLWIGTAHKGLSLFNKKSGKFSYPKVTGVLGKDFTSSSIYSLLKADKHTLWIGTGYDGLYSYNTKTFKAKKYFHINEDSKISNSKIRVIYKDKESQIWVGTQSGLNLFNEKTDRFIRFLKDPNNPQSISNNEILCMLEDAKNRFWIGTRKGLNLMNRDNATFQSYTLKDGLPNDVICGMLEGKQGEIWLSTKKGLSRFDPDSLSFRNYYKEDGLQGNEFAAYVYCKTDSGELYFGGNNGFNRFDPNTIKENLTVPEVCITGFKISNQEMSVNTEGSPLQKHITQTREITLSHQQNSVTFEYVALNYSSPSQNEYQYKMEGFDGDWNYVKNKKEANYTNLDPGTYVFRVKASNNDGIWNNEGSSIIIHILPPPWLTWWAYLSYVLITVALLFWLRKSALNKIKKEKEHELEQQKINFFVNVSHEFRTPISLIINPINKLLKGYNPDDDKKAIATIHQSAHKLSNLVNQLLDIRKLEFGKMPLQVYDIEIVDFTKGIIRDFSELASVKNLTIKYYNNESTIQTWIDPDKYEKVINNLLSNAIKFSDKGGEITVSIKTIENSLGKSFVAYESDKQITPKQLLQIEVEDRGIGIKKEDLSLVFDRFYSSAKAGTGTGIGLNYTKSLVELHSGNIEVRSEYGKGSIFTIQLPLGKEYFNQAHLSKIEFDQNNFTANIGDRESLRYELNATDEVITSNSGKTEEQNTSIDKTHKLILIVEDNKSLRLQLKSELQEHYRVIDAPNGVKALEKVKKTIPDLVISDVMMPEMDGIELCQHMKTSADTCHVPVILLTAKTLVEHRIEGYETGADDYISKPFDLHELKVRIKNIIDLRAAIKDKFLNSEALLKVSKIAENNKDEAFLDKVVSITLEHMSNPDFSINELQDLLAMSRTSFYSKVSSLTNMSPSHFLNTIRIKHAAELLLNNELAVKEIAYTCGFSSPSYFNKVFRKVLNKTPLQYIKENS